MFILVDEINGQAFGPFETEDAAMHVVLTGEGAGDVPWGENGWSILPLMTEQPKRPHETLEYVGDEGEAWEHRTVVTVTANSHRASDDMVWAMDGGQPLVKVLDRWFAKEVGMKRAARK